MTQDLAPGKTRPAHRPTVLVVDDIDANRELMAAFLRDVDCTVVTAEDGGQALDLAGRQRVDLVLLDVAMPGINGFEVCRRIKSSTEGQLTPVVMVTAATRTVDRVAALEAGADDFLGKPVDRVELLARVRSALRLKAVFDGLERAEQVIFALAAAVEAKDAFTGPHTARVGASAQRVGERLGLDATDLESLLRGGLIHDIGKIGIPDTVLLKPGGLSDEETAMMRQHPVIGAEIVKPLSSAASLEPIVRHHHENFDGTGYPDRLGGEEIPLLARIVAICDAYDALTSDRPYRRGRSADEAMRVLRRGAGQQWDPDLVELVTTEHGSARFFQTG